MELFYADDDEENLIIFDEAVKKICSKYNYKINLHLHKNGEYLLGNLKKNKHKAGVVFLDLNMPVKSGFQILKEIRQDHEVDHIPIIIYSTSSDKNAITTSQYLGANFYAIKPTTFVGIKQLIKKAVQINWKEHEINFENFIFNNLPDRS